MSLFPRLFPFQQVRALEDLKAAGLVKRLLRTVCLNTRTAFLPTKDLGSGRMKSVRLGVTAFGTG